MHRVILSLIVLLTSPLLSSARQTPPERPRVIISTDIGGTDPDDNQSLTHLLMYSDEFDLEGLISSPSFGDGSTSEIFRMIDVYEKDFPVLRSHFKGLMRPRALRRLVKQGRTSEMHPCGFGGPTEGSRHIVKQARRHDKRPLYILVWGCLEDVAQALHDAPDIASKIRVYWIGGPNKKWGVNAYCYIVENFPDLWFIENNTTYRGFIYDSKNKDRFNLGFYDNFIRGAGNLGAYFAAYYKGNPKLGDTPSLLYMMDGDPSFPERLSWGGSFSRVSHTPRSVFFGPTTATDTVSICSIIEWHLRGPVCLDVAVDSACLTLDIRGQKWRGYYKGAGLYVIRHSTYYTGTLPYSISSTIDGFPSFSGVITVRNSWPLSPSETDYNVGPNWWTDNYDPGEFSHNYAGARQQLILRNEIMEDWGKRWHTLK